MPPPSLPARLDLLDANKLPPIRTGTIAVLAAAALVGATAMGKASDPDGYVGAAVALAYTAAVGYPTHAVKRVVWTTLGLLSCLALSQVDPNWAISFAQPDLVSSDWVAAPWALQAIAAISLALLAIAGTAGHCRSSRWHSWPPLAPAANAVHLRPPLASAGLLAPIPRYLFATCGK
jgi:hypothetical protein